MPDSILRVFFFWFSNLIHTANLLDNVYSDLHFTKKETEVIRGYLVCRYK